MNIEISDNVLTSIIQKELVKVSTPSYTNKSHLEIAVQKAVQEITKQKVMELIKGDPEYIVLLNNDIEKNMVFVFTEVAKRISKNIADSIVSAIESEFKMYSD